MSALKTKKKLIWGNVVIEYLIQCIREFYWFPDEWEICASSSLSELGINDSIIHELISIVNKVIALKTSKMLQYLISSSININTLANLLINNIHMDSNNNLLFNSELFSGINMPGDILCCHDSFDIKNDNLRYLKKNNAESMFSARKTQSNLAKNHLLLHEGEINILEVMTFGSGYLVIFLALIFAT